MLKSFRKITRHPIRLVPITFLIAIAITTVLLSLPIAKTGPGGAPFLDAVFTATSAITVTGLITQDTPVYWSGFGEAVIMFAMQVGGLGIMTSAALLGLLVSKKLGLRSRMIAQSELHTGISLGDLRGVLFKSFAVAGIVELLVAAILTFRFYHGYGMSRGEALWQGLFHGVSAFNNGGFSLFSDSLMGFVDDPLVILPVAFAAFTGSLGVLVIFEVVRRHWGRRKWTLHTKMTLTGTTILLVGSFFVFLVFEWSNPATFGPLSWDGKALAALFQSVMPRTTGFNSIDVASMHDHSILVSIILTFIGGGAASTSGGIKVTTFFVLLWVIWSEVRGEPDASAFRTRLSTAVIRQSLTIALVYVAFNAAAIIVLQMFNPSFELLDIMFEATSAISTVGQSLGITATMTDASKVLVIFMMYGGRIGPVLVATSLAMRTRQRLYRYPEGRPLVG